MRHFPLTQRSLELLSELGPQDVARIVSDIDMHLANGSLEPSSNPTDQLFRHVILPEAQSVGYGPWSPEDGD